MMTVSKEILMHPDFIANLADELCEMLEAFIDAEFEKGDETDFDFIDECADAINAIRSGDTAQILPLISRKDFLKKLGVKTDSKIKVFVAACAAIALIFTVGTQIEIEENISIMQALSGIVSEFFGTKQQVVTTAQPETTTEQQTEETAFITGINVETDSEFKSEYYVGEEFSEKGIRVFAEYSNGERILVKSDGYTVEIPESFATQPKYEKIIIKSSGFTHEITVRVIESLKTKKLNSIYALFPDDFDFTTEDVKNIDLSDMQVYAVYSDGSEKELSADEYTVEYEYEKTLFEESSTVTVSYENCSCSFMIFKE